MLLADGKKPLVFTRVDKAANCLCIMCKACYVQLATDKMEGPGYSRIEGVDLASIKSTIIKRQADFLRQEHLPIPLLRKQSDEDLPATILVPTDRLPVRYITAKLHKNPVAARGITTCCGSPMDGIAKIVNACLAALRPVLHALWRDKCVARLVYFLMNVGLHRPVQKSSILYVPLMLQPIPSLVQSTTIGLKLA